MSIGLSIFATESVLSILLQASNFAEQRESTFSLLLSGLLVLLYYFQYQRLNKQVEIQDSSSEIARKQSEILEQQTEIMENQERWMKREHLPQLSVDEWKITGERGQSVVKVSNFGNGAAEDLALELSLKPQKIEQAESETLDPDVMEAMGLEKGLPIEEPPSDLPEEFIEKKIVELLFETDSDRGGRSSRSIRPSSQNLYSSEDAGFSKVLVNTDGGGGFEIEIEDYFDRMVNYGVEIIRWEVALKYRHSGSVTESQGIYGGYIYPEDFESIPEMIKQPQITVLPAHSISPEFALTTEFI